MANEETVPQRLKAIAALLHGAAEDLVNQFKDGRVDDLLVDFHKECVAIEQSLSPGFERETFAACVARTFDYISPERIFK